MIAELKEVLQKVEQLNNNEQKSIAKLINEELEWDNTLNKTQDNYQCLLKRLLKSINPTKQNKQDW
jgi:hypothetical protein